MRVLHVVEAMDLGGAESLVVEHARHAAPDVQTFVCALNRGGPALEAARDAGARALVLEKGRGRWSGLGRLARLMRDEKIDVVNGHNPTGGLYAALAGAAAGVPVVRTEHSVHYPGRHSGLYAWALEPLVTSIARRVICVCEASRISHASRLAWAERRFVTVLNGISAAPPARPRDAMRAELGLAPGARVILSVGSLTRQKAQHTLIEAVALLAGRIPEVSLVIAGEGPLRRDLEALALARGAGDTVRLIGARRDVADLLEACDVFTLSSQREGLSVTLLEAMRAGRAAVATRVGGNGEAIADGETGLLVPPEDPGRLAGALESLLAEPARAAAFGRAARIRWAERFTAERMVGETEAIYRAVLGIEAPAARGHAEVRHASARA